MRTGYQTAGSFLFRKGSAVNTQEDKDTGQGCEEKDEGLTSIHPCIHCPATEERCCLSEEDWKSVDRFLDILARVALEIAARDAS